MEAFVFYLFATIAVVAALFVVLQSRAIYSALALIVCFGALAALFFQLGAQFIAAIQVIVYAGAIMVLFLFVVMLIDPESEIFTVNRLPGLPLLALPLSAFLAFFLLWVLPELVPAAAEAEPFDLTAKGQIDVVAHSLFRDYLLPFEVTSILILVAVLGAIVLAKRSE